MPTIQYATSNDKIICNINDKYSGIITEYADVFKPELRQQHTAKPKHGIFHHIPTTGPLCTLDLGTSAHKN